MLVFFSSVSLLVIHPGSVGCPATLTGCCFTIVPGAGGADASIGACGLGASAVGMFSSNDFLFDACVVGRSLMTHRVLAFGESGLTKGRFLLMGVGAGITFGARNRARYIFIEPLACWKTLDASWLGTGCRIASLGWLH